MQAAAFLTHEFVYSFVLPAVLGGIAATLMIGADVAIRRIRNRIMKRYVA